MTYVRCFEVCRTDKQSRNSSPRAMGTCDTAGPQMLSLKRHATTRCHVLDAIYSWCARKANKHNTRLPSNRRKNHQKD